MYEAGDPPGALDVFEQSLELRRDRPTDSARLAHSSASARRSLRSGLSEQNRCQTIYSKQPADPRTEHFAYHFLGDCALIHGDFDEAETRYRQACKRGCRSET